MGMCGAPAASAHCSGICAAMMALRNSQATGQPACAAPAVQPKPATVVAAPATGSQTVKSKPPPTDATMHPNRAAAASAAQAEAPATSAPTLDLAALKQRLRDTRAIGVFTKLALKNQVDDLLDKFRGFYGGQLKTTLPELRLYELLVQKLLALLQDSDPPLAREIAASREAIWGLLADPHKFATI
jgi:hypothetical protein